MAARDRVRAALAAMSGVPGKDGNMRSDAQLEGIIAAAMVETTNPPTLAYIGSLRSSYAYDPRGEKNHKQVIAYGTAIIVESLRRLGRHYQSVTGALRKTHSPE
jgi:hypothetical protein